MGGRKPKQKQCLKCLKERNLKKDFYLSNSSNYADNRYPICKACLRKNLTALDDDPLSSAAIESVKSVLLEMNRPFINSIYLTSVEESEKTGNDVFGNYMKNLHLGYRNKTWKDSEFESEPVIVKNEKNDELDNTRQKIIHDEIELTDDEIKYLKAFWGKGYSLEDLIWLQTEYEDWTSRYECDSKSMETLIQEICKQQLDINIRRARGDKVDQQLKTFQDLLGSSSLKPVQETGANAADQETFGTLIKKYENEKPIPEPEPEWKDVDNIGKYIRVFFLGHLTRMLGIKNKYADEYWDELNRYTVDEPEVEEESEELI